MSPEHCLSDPFVPVLRTDTVWTGARNLVPWLKQRRRVPPSALPRAAGDLLAQRGACPGRYCVPGWSAMVTHVMGRVWVWVLPLILAVESLLFCLAC